MELTAIFLSILGTILLSFGSGGPNIKTDVFLSMSMRGYNLEIAKERGRQRISIIMGIIVYILGTISLVPSMFDIDVDMKLQLIVVMPFTVFMLLIHYFNLMPLAGKKTMLATMKYFFFVRENGLKSWESDSNTPGWINMHLNQLGFNENITKEELEKIIRSTSVKL